MSRLYLEMRTQDYFIEPLNKLGAYQYFKSPRGSVHRFAKDPSVSFHEHLLLYEVTAEVI